MQTILNLIILFTFAIPTFAAESKWEPITSEKRPTCDEESPCRISAGSTAFEIRFITKPDGKVHYFKAIELKNLKNQEVQKIELSQVNGIEQDEFFKIYKVQIRPGTKNPDLALWAYNSANAGPTYYYLFFDPKTEKFVASTGTLPKVKYDAKKKNYVTDIQGLRYTLNGNDFVPVK